MWHKHGCCGSGWVSLPVCISDTGSCAFKHLSTCRHFIMATGLSIIDSQLLLDLCIFRSCRHQKNALLHIVCPWCRPALEQSCLCHIHRVQYWITLAACQSLTFSYSITRRQQCYQSYNENIPVLSSAEPGTAYPKIVHPAPHFCLLWHRKNMWYLLAFMTLQDYLTILWHCAVTGRQVKIASVADILQSPPPPPPSPSPPTPTPPPLLLLNCCNTLCFSSKLFSFICFLSCLVCWSVCWRFVFVGFGRWKWVCAWHSIESRSENCESLRRHSYHALATRAWKGTLWW